MNKQQLIAKYGKRFTIDAKSKTPILEGIHYAADGNVIVTNRLYALRIRDAHSFGTPITLHAKTGTPIEGIYPDVSKAFPVNFEHELLLRSGAEMDAALQSTRVMMNAANTINKKVPLIRLFAQNGSAHLQIKTDSLDLKAFLGNTLNLKPIDMRSFNAEYLTTALEVFADAEIDVTLKLQGIHDPILLTGGDIDVLIVPYRVAE